MITVHHLEHSRAHRVLWLLEELGLDYQLTTYARDPQTLLAPPALRAVHPLGKSPVITDGAVTLAESGAILEYLAERHGDGRLVPPAGSPEWLRHRYWMHYAEGSAAAPLLLKLVCDRVAQAPAPFFVRPLLRAVSGKVKDGFVLPQLRLHLDFMESELARGPWFAGADFSVADIQMSYPLEVAGGDGMLAARPRLADFLARIRARPAHQRATARGGPAGLPA